MREDPVVRGCADKGRAAGAPRVAFVFSRRVIKEGRQRARGLCDVVWREVEGGNKAGGVEGK